MTGKREGGLGGREGRRGKDMWSESLSSVLSSSW